MRIATRWLPWAPLLYSLVALACSSLLRTSLPLPLERILAWIAMPLLFLFLPLYPLLRPLGLVEGEWIKGPTPLGILVGAAIYGALLWLAMRLLLPRP